MTANRLLVRAIDEQPERDRLPSAQNAAWTTPEEIVCAILYLGPEAAGVVNGARLPFHGGRPAHTLRMGICHVTCLSVIAARWLPSIAAVRKV